MHNAKQSCLIAEGVTKRKMCGISAEIQRFHPCGVVGGGGHHRPFGGHSAAGVLAADAPVGLTDSKGSAVPVQTRVMERHTDGSVRWLLVDYQAALFLSKLREKEQLTLVGPAAPMFIPHVAQQQSHLSSARAGNRIIKPELSPIVQKTQYCVNK